MALQATDGDENPSGVRPSGLPGCPLGPLLPGPPRRSAAAAPKGCPTWTFNGAMAGVTG